MNIFFVNKKTGDEALKSNTFSQNLNHIQNGNTKKINHLDKN